MPYEIVFAPGAVQDFRRLKAQVRATVRDAIERHLRKEEVIITRHGKPAGVLIGFETEEDWLDYRLENDPQFWQRIEAARRDLRRGRGTRLEDLEATS